MCRPTPLDWIFRILVISLKIFLRPDLDLEKISYYPWSHNGIVGGNSSNRQSWRTSKNKWKISMLKLSPVASLHYQRLENGMSVIISTDAGSFCCQWNSSVYMCGGHTWSTLVVYDGFSVYHVDHLFGFFGIQSKMRSKMCKLFKGGFESKIRRKDRFSCRRLQVKKVHQTAECRYQCRISFYNGEVEVPIGDKITTPVCISRDPINPDCTIKFSTHSIVAVPRYPM